MTQGVCILCLLIIDLWATPFLQFWLCEPHPSYNFGCVNPTLPTILAVWTPPFLQFWLCEPHPSYNLGCVNHTFPTIWGMWATPFLPFWLCEPHSSYNFGCVSHNLPTILAVWTTLFLHFWLCEPHPSYLLPLLESPSNAHCIFLSLIIHHIAFATGHQTKCNILLICICKSANPRQQ